MNVTLRNASFRGNKAVLPGEPCVGCGPSMNWRQRWANNWSDMKCCSDACRHKGAARG